ncbi:MAG TPA: hypothetical protein VIH68_07775, partial [Bacteroidota bacterium]
ALEKDPEDRYQTATDMLIDLRRLKKETSKVSRAYTVPRDSSREPVTAPAEESAVATGPAAAPRPARLMGLALTAKTLWIAAGGIAVIAAIALIFILKPKGTPELNPEMTFRVLQIPFTQANYPGLSPDGNWLAFPAADANNKWDVYFMNSSGGEPRRITNDSSLYISQTDVSPDGSQISYERLNLQAQTIEAYVVSSLGGLSKKIADAGLVSRWRPDGQRIGYVKGPAGRMRSESGHMEFWSVKTDGSDPRLEFVDTVSVRGRFSFSWSPEGTSVAWIKSFPGGFQEVFVHDLETGDERQLTDDRKNVDEVCWTRQNEIIFSSNRSGNTNLWLVPADGGQTVQLTKGSGPDIGMKISADGKKLLYLQQQEIGHVWVANTDGSKVQQVTFDDRRISEPAFSPDGKQIVFSMYDPDPLKVTRSIYVMDRDGGNRRELTSGEGVAESPEWSPDGKWLAFVSHSASVPHDSANVYLIQPSSPGPPKLVGAGVNDRWLSANSILLYTASGTLETYLDETPPRRVLNDSTIVNSAPILGGKYVLFADTSKGREGLYIAAYDSSKRAASGNARKLLSFDARFTVGPDGKFLLIVRSANQASRMSLPDGREERIKGTFPGLSLASDVAVSHDGKEIVYIDQRLSAKLVLIENLHK